MNRSQLLRLALGLFIFCAQSSLRAEEPNAVLVRHGYTQLQAHNFEAAIRDFDAAILVEPTDGAAFLGRAYARHNLADLPGAIADYTKAIELARTIVGVPQWDKSLANMFFNRGKARYDGRQWAEAAVDYENALKCDPSMPPAYVGLGNVKRRVGEYAGSLAAFDHVISLAPQGPVAGIAYQERAITRQFMGDQPGAIADYRQVLSLTPAHADYAHLFIWTARVRLGERPAADAELSAYLKVRAPSLEGDWAVTIAGFLLGTTAEVDFLAAAQKGTDVTKVKGQVCEAWYYSGLKHLLAGDRRGAADYFQRCIATDMWYFIEYDLAAHELAVLK